MATSLQERVPPRRKMATYGKAARRRIPEFNFASMSRKSENPDLSEASNEIVKSMADTASQSAAPSNLGVLSQRPLSRTTSGPPSPSGDVYEVPDSDNDSRMPIRKKTPTPPKNKPKPIRPKTILKMAVTTSSSTDDIWDVPDDGTKPVRQQATPPGRLKAPFRSRKSPSTTPPSASPQKQGVFDVPSSDDEKVPPSTKRKAVQKQITSLTSSTYELSESLSEGSKKKLRLSPVSDLPPKRAPLRHAIRPPRSHSIMKPMQSQDASLKAGQMTKMAARPKIQPLERRPGIVQSQQGRSLQPQRSQIVPITLSHSGSDVEMLDVALTVPPRGMKILQDLMDSVETTDEESANSGTKRSLGSDSSSSNLSRPSEVSKNSCPRIIPRRRLIDPLVEQTQEESDDETSEDSSDVMSDSMPTSQEAFDFNEVLESQVLNQFTSNPAPIAADSQGSQVGPKITYTRVRSMLDEQDIMHDLQMELPIQSASRIGRPRRVLVPGLKPLPSFHADEDDDENTTSVIRSVHELRLAGANNRFLDEVQDFLERIGSPGKTSSATSMRRSGLLDLASKMKDKTFSKQFRDNGVEQKLFLHLGQETDIVSGFIMVSLLISVLLEGNMPHIVPQLRRQGITRLIIRLLECHSNIVAISKERKSNMSRIAQSLLAEHQDYLLRLSTWEEDELQPKILSPRTLALKCLEIMIRQTREAGVTGDILSKELTTGLFAILNTASNIQCWVLPSGKEAIDFYLALSALESHSITARTLKDGAIWIREYLPIVANTLEIALSRPNETYGKLQVLLLRLTLNVTNNNPEASEIFTRPMLMSTMAQAVVLRFKLIMRFLTEEELEGVLEHLVLILGVMINFAEWSSAARESLQNLQGQEEDSLDLIIKIFTENREKTSMADSMEETSKNVAFGYLSVLLGYLALLPAISTRVKQTSPRKTLTPLILSIEEFISHHKAVDQLHADSDGHNPQAGLTERLENLVSKLTQLL